VWLNSNESHDQDLLLFIDTDPNFEKHCLNNNEIEINQEIQEKELICDEDMEDS
jgi:hypothetical protein